MAYRVAILEARAQDDNVATVWRLQFASSTRTGRPVSGERALLTERQPGKGERLYGESAGQELVELLGFFGVDSGVVFLGRGLRAIDLELRSVVAGETGTATAAALALRDTRNDTGAGSDLVESVSHSFLLLERVRVSFCTLGDSDGTTGCPRNFLDEDVTNNIPVRFFRVPPSSASWFRGRRAFRDVFRSMLRSTSSTLAASTFSLSNDADTWVRETSSLLSRFTALLGCFSCCTKHGCELSERTTASVPT